MPHHHHGGHYGGHHGYYGGHHGFFDYHHHHGGFYPGFHNPMFPVVIETGPMMRPAPHVDVYNVNTVPTVPVYAGVQYPTAVQYSAGMPVSSMQSAPYPAGTAQTQYQTAQGYGSAYPSNTLAPGYQSAPMTRSLPGSPNISPSNSPRPPTSITPQPYMTNSPQMNYQPNNQQMGYNPTAPPANDPPQAFGPPPLYTDGPPTYNDVMVQQPSIERTKL